MTSPRNPQEPSAQTSIRTEAKSKEAYVKAKERISALYRGASLRRSRGPALVSSSRSCGRQANDAPASAARTAAFSFLLALGAMLLTAAPAWAAETAHVIQPTTAFSFPFSGLSNPVGVAEDQSAHLIYVSDLTYSGQTVPQVHHRR